MAKPVYTLAQAKAQLDSGAGWRGAAISYAIPDALANTGGESAGFVRMGAGMKAGAATAFELWDDLIAPSLNQVQSGAQITFAYSTATNSSTYASYSFFPDTPRDRISDADIWFDARWPTHDQDSDIRPGSYGFLTYLHEIGHALGLEHPGNYGSNATYASDAVYAQDTYRFTVMSYFDAADANDGSNHRGSNPATPMLHDIAAIQTIYGADLTTRAGNTVYGFNSTAGREAFDFSINTKPVVTIYDAGGADTFNLSGYSMAQTIDLRQGKYSSVGGLTLNTAIAFGTVIESAIGGSAADTIYGNTSKNTLVGGAGADSLYGLAGNDILRGGAGRDRLDGGVGIDSAAYSGNRAAYTVTERADGSVVVAGGADGGDTLFAIEKLVFADQTLIL